MSKPETKTEKERKIMNVFVSYAVADKGYASKLRDLLSHRTNTRIFSPEELGVSEDWSSRLRDAISKCDLFVVLLSCNSVHSSWVLQELGAAWSLDKPILPVVVDPLVIKTLPVELENTQTLSFNDLEDPRTMNNVLDEYEKKFLALDCDD